MTFFSRLAFLLHVIKGRLQVGKRCVPLCLGVVLLAPLDSFQSFFFSEPCPASKTLNISLGDHDLSILGRLAQMSPPYRQSS